MQTLTDNSLNGYRSAKSVKEKKPSTKTTIRLISGRNSPSYSFGESNIIDNDPNIIGEQVLSIWNERVSAIRQRYKFARTVVIIKSYSLEEVVIFEFETLRYEPDLYYWEWNKNTNLEGFEKRNSNHIFTWQHSGSQFTIIKKVPDDCLVIKINKPETLDKESFLRNMGFNKDWISVSRKND